MAGSSGHGNWACPRSDVARIGPLGDHALNAKRKLTVVAALSLVILLLLPVAGEIVAPLRTSEMMGGRMMVWGLLWLLAIVLVILFLLVVGAVAAWQRLRQ